MDEMMLDIVKEYDIDRSKIVLGGYSAGGVIALRYTELMHENPQSAAVLPRAVFMVDSPVDLYHLWDMQQENRRNNYSEISVNEAIWIERYFNQYYGATPSEDPEMYRELSPFSMDTVNGQNEKYLSRVAVRAYHDIDVAWRLIHRNQTARFDNYIPTSELINRLMLMGNDRAEFMQSFQTGYRRNGERHPHSWSIVDQEECILWMKKVLDD